MPSRNNLMVRRDINRLNDLIMSRGADVLALSAIAEDVASATDKVNDAWQALQAVSIAGDKEREERDSAIGELMKWIQLWRPVIMIKVPGASDNLRKLPTRGATPDDAIRVAVDMLKFINENPAAGNFRDQAVESLGGRLENAEKETAEATTVLPQEAVYRDNFTDACLEANSILIRSLNIVRSAFGPTSPEYKQFIARASAEDDEDEDEVPVSDTVG